MSQSQTIDRQIARPAERGAAVFAVDRWRQAWDRSLRFRLLILGLMPLLAAFPFVLGVVVLVGGEMTDRLNILGELGGALGSEEVATQI